MHQRNLLFFHDQRVEEGLCDPEVPTSAPNHLETYDESVVDEPQLSYQGNLSFNPPTSPSHYLGHYMCKWVLVIGK